VLIKKLRCIAAKILLSAVGAIRSRRMALTRSDSHFRPLTVSQSQNSKRQSLTSLWLFRESAPCWRPSRHRVKPTLKSLLTTAACTAGQMTKLR
jgi:hypothetical protein